MNCDANPNYISCQRHVDLRANPDGPWTGPNSPTDVTRRPFLELSSPPQPR